MKRSGRQIVCVAAAVGMALSLPGCGEQKKAALPQERIQSVRVTRPVERDFTWSIRVQGNVQPMQKAEISSRINGNLDKKNVGDGQIVKRGEELFQVDESNLFNNVEIQKQKVEVAKAELETAKVDLELTRTILEKARKDYDRALQLSQSRAISDDAFERAVLNFQEAEANIKKAEAVEGHMAAKLKQEEGNLKIAEKQYDDSTVKAPFDGVVVSTSKDQGEYVKEGDIILLLENQDAYEISLLISSLYYDTVVAGKTPAVIYSIDGEKLATVPVSYRSPSIDKLSRTFEIKITLPKSDKIVSGMLCDIDLVLRRSHGYGVPSEAVLLRQNDRRIVYVDKNGIAEAVTVRVGIVDGGYTELLDGTELKDSEIIYEGQAFLNNGDRVSVIGRIAQGE